MYIEFATRLKQVMTAKGIKTQSNYLVIGTRASPEWIAENFGRKIQKAADMAESGMYEISIIREVDWTMSLNLKKYKSK